MAQHAAAVLVAVLLLVTWPAPAQAHSDLVGSTPRDGDMVSRGIDRLVLVFGEDLVPGSGQVVVRDDDDVDVVAGAGEVTGSTLEVPLTVRGAGRHVVTYRVVAGDGHAIVGELSFEVAAGTPRPRSAGSATTGAGASGGSPVVPVVPPPPTTREGALVPPLWWALAASTSVGAVLLLHRGLGRAARRGQSAAGGT